MCLDINNPVNTKIRLAHYWPPTFYLNMFVKYWSVCSKFIEYLLLIYENLSGPVVMLSSLHTDDIRISLKWFFSLFCHVNSHCSCYTCVMWMTEEDTWNNKSFVMFFIVLAKKKGPMGDEHKSNSFKRKWKIKCFPWSKGLGFRVCSK